MIVVEQRDLTAAGEPTVDDRRTAFPVTCAHSRLPNRMWCQLPSAGRDQQQELARIQKVVALRDGLPPSEVEELDGVAIWPLAMVTNDGRVVGWLTRLVDRDFYVETEARDGRPASRFVINLLRGSAIDDDLVRLALLSRLAYAIEIVHRPRAGRRLVYGDLSLRAVAVAVEPPRILLLGGDGVADVEDTTRAQMHSPYFLPPDPGLQDQSTDVYKLGLCTIRALSIGREAARVTDAANPLVRPGMLDQAGIDLLNRAVGADRAWRPTAEDIKDYLIGRVLHLVSAEREPR